MIINNISNKTFVILEIDRVSDTLVIAKIESFIYYGKDKSSVESCGAATAISSIGMNFLVLMLNSDMISRIPIHQQMSFLDTQPFKDSIVGYCYIRNTPLFHEIWDVCIFAEVRAQKLGQAFINHIATYFNTKNLWLVVKPHNIAAAKTYIKNGFKINNILKTDSNGAIMGFPTPYISFIRKIAELPPTADDIDTQVKLFQKYSSIITEDIIRHNLHIYFDSDTLTFIKSMTDNVLVRNEIGGGIQIYNESIIHNGVEYFKLDIVNETTKGHRNKCNILDTEDHSFYYHTHPSSLYEVNFYTLQFPSAEDLRLSLYKIIDHQRHNITTCVSFTFCYLGMFVATLNQDFSYFLRTVIKLIGREDYLILILNIVIKNFAYTIYYKSTFSASSLLESYLSSASYLNGDLNGQSIVRKKCAKTMCDLINTLTVEDILNADVMFQELVDLYTTVKDPNFNPSLTQLFNIKYYSLINDTSQPMEIGDAVVQPAEIPSHLFIDCEVDFPANLRELNPPIIKDRVDYQNLYNFEAALSLAQIDTQFKLSPGKQ